MARKFDKETLFDDFFITAKNTLLTFENTFCVEGVWSQVFGVDDQEKYQFTDASVEQKARDHLRASGAWASLSNLYDYAVDGIANDHPIDIVLGAADILHFITTELDAPSQDWFLITAQGDGRHALDDGQEILLDKLALLANVDTRTVRNAISAGELIAEKHDGGLFIENASARKWLNGRRGFKPTVMVEDQVTELNQINSPAEFGAFLVAQRKKIGMDGEANKLVAFHSSANASAISEIENGVFNLPLDAVFPIADFYQIDRKKFLSCVMRVFFGEQLSALREELK